MSNRQCGGALFHPCLIQRAYKVDTHPVISSQTSTKHQLRKHALNQRAALSPEAKQHYSARIMKSLFGHLRQSIPTDYHLLAYKSLPDEVNTTTLFESGHRVIYAPRMHGKEDMHWLGVTENTHWVKGHFGIEEPAHGPDWEDEESLAVLICPLVGFDRTGNRLGMGKGCFDRWLAEHRHRITEIIGIAFSCQEVTAIPNESHDIPLHTIITEKEVISCQTH